MDQEPLVPLRLRQLFDAVCDEVATNEQIEELQSILRADEKARQYYMEYCQLIVDLFFEACERQMMADAVDALVEVRAPVETTATAETSATSVPKTSSANPPAVPVTAIPVTDSPTKSPVLGFLGGVIDYVNHSRVLMFWLMALLVTGWFAFQLGSLMMGRTHPGGAPVAGQPAGPNSSDVSTPPGGPFANSASPRPSDSVTSTTVAFMTTIVDCHWRVVPPAAPSASAPAPGDVNTVLYNGEPFHTGSELSAGQQLDLVRGLAKITFRSGARIVLNGPAHFSIGSPLGGKLQIGKLTARVPHDAHGFTVNTPAGKVVDLGTEFGVAVAANHTMDVEVFVGEVAVDASLADGQTPSSPSASPTKPQKLTAGHAAHVEAGKPVATIPLDPKRFVRGLGPREDGHVAQAAYLDFVRSLKPVVWFRMEGKETDRVLHDEMGGLDAKLYWDGPGNPFVEGPVGKSLWLRGVALKDCAMVPGYAPTRHGKLSASAWVYADDRPFNATIVENWGGGGQFRFSLYGKDAQGYAKDLCVYVRQTNGSLVFAHEGETHLFPLNQWQHVAFTTDGTTLRLYRHGREVASATHSGLSYPVPQKALAIGIQANAAGDAPGNDPWYWSGKLDEIAIFDDALSADDIRKLAAAPPQ